MFCKVHYFDLLAHIRAHFRSNHLINRSLLDTSHKNSLQVMSLIINCLSQNLSVFISSHKFADPQFMQQQPNRLSTDISPCVSSTYFQLWERWSLSACLLKSKVVSTFFPYLELSLFQTTKSCSKGNRLHTSKLFDKLSSSLR